MKFIQSEACLPMQLFDFIFNVAHFALLLLIISALIVVIVVPVSQTKLLF
eukprot:m.235203 g.235203  ORF g.235203 m.235203 type:complete len:50 (-) comp16040_c0_seq7:222-371(-)